MRKNKLIAKITAITLAVTLGTFSFFSGTTKTALADIVESTTQAVTEMQTETEKESETVNTDGDVETVNEKQNDNQEKATEAKTEKTEGSKSDDVAEDETEELVKEVNPTKYSSATVTIHRVSNGKAVANSSFEIFGVKDNGESYETLEQFKGMKFYSYGIKKTDENGNLTFTDLSLDEDEWYFLKDLSNDNVINFYQKNDFKVLYKFVTYP